MITFERVETAEQIEQLANLAHEIWFEYWPERIGLNQTEYMVEKFQSLPAIKRDMKENGYEYFFLIDEEGETVGYAGVVQERFSSNPEDPHANVHGEEITKRFMDRLFISKVYLLKDERGKHYSSQALARLSEYARENGLEGLYLTVNRDNELAIRAYIGNGFEIIESLDADIGEGFTMYDHIMARAV